LLGRHHTALEDLQKATELADDADAASEAPAWVSLLKAVCLYDESQLDAAVAHPKHGYLARLLRIVAGAGGSRHRTVQEAAQLLKSFPDSDFALVSMYVNSNYSIKRQLAELASRALVANMYDRILAIPELPLEVKKLAATLKAEAEAESDVTEDQDDDREVLLSPERQGRLKLIEALHEAGSVENDTGELSWGCLGQLILEATFMQAVLQASNQQWSGDDDQLLEQLLPTIGDHPYRNYLLTTSQDPNRVFLAREQVFDELWIGEVELHVRNVFDQFYYSGNQAAYHRYLYAAQVHAGDVFPDLIAGLNSEDKYQRQMWIRRMQRVAPHQPLTIAKSIHYDWPFVEDRWEELENRYLQAEDVQLALGHKLTELNSYQAAERCLKRRMALLPNGDAYNGLAKYYKKTKQIEKWLATMDEFLKSDEAFGNMGAGARIEVAEYYMQKKQWEKARPYAYQAAEQGSQRKALYCAIKCAEGLGDYEAAETFMRAVSERHSEYQLEWYCWCKKNNFGDLAAARELAVNHLDSIESPTQAQWMYSFGIFYLLEGELDEAIIAIENAFEGKSDPYMGLHLAIIADELEEPEIRDKAILQVLEHGKDQPSSDVVGLEMVQIAKVFQSLYASNGQKKLNLEKVNEIFKSAKEWEKNRIDYFVGRVLLKYGESGDAEKHLLRSAQSEQPTFTQLLAASLLHERGIDYRDETASEVK